MFVEQQETIEVTEQKSEHFCRYLGLIALALNKETSHKHLEQQVITELAESLNAEMGTHGAPIHLSYQNDQLLDSEGRNMSQSALEWSLSQQNRAHSEPNLQWFADIANIEAQEHKQVAIFAQKAEPGNVLWVLSLFPEEAFNNAATKEAVMREGFRSDIKRSFLRVYEKTANGIFEHIQSIDSSDLNLWNKSLEKQLGLKPAANTAEILARRVVQRGIPAQEILEKIVTGYDTELYAQTGNIHKYGRNPSTQAEANNFVRQHMPIVQDTIAELGEIGFVSSQADAQVQRIMYNSKAAINRMFEGKQYNTKDMRSIRLSEGTASVQKGESFYGCSGVNEAMGVQANQLSHANSLSMNGIMRCVTCPFCKKIVDARRDYKGGIQCLSNKCGAKINSQGKRIDVSNKIKTKEKPNQIIEALQFWFGAN